MGTNGLDTECHRQGQKALRDTLTHCWFWPYPLRNIVVTVKSKLSSVMVRQHVLMFSFTCCCLVLSCVFTLHTAGLSCQTFCVCLEAENGGNMEEKCFRNEKESKSTISMQSTGMYRSSGS